MPAAIGLIDPETLKKFRVWFKIYGVVMIILGLASIMLPGDRLARDQHHGRLAAGRRRHLRPDLGFLGRHQGARLLVESC